VLLSRGLGPRAYSPPKRQGYVVVRNWTDLRRRYFRQRDLNVVRSIALLALVVTIVSCRKKVRFEPTKRRQSRVCNAGHR
jgi:hypothetical protein